METVGFIGLGNMGGGMSSNIQKAGYQLIVYDVREESTRRLLEGGARLGNSPADVASRSDITFTSLPGPKEVEAVVLGKEGILEGIKPGTIYVDLSSSRPTLIREMEPKFTEKGAFILDAPISGGKSGAESGNLAVMVGGDKAIFDQIKPILDSFGDKVFYAGGIGNGSVCKLVHNMIGHSVRQAIAEGLTLGVKAGVDAESLWECMRRGSLGRMRVLHETLVRTMFRNTYEPATFALDLAYKDISLACELAEEYNVPMPITVLARQITLQAVNRGWGSKDSAIAVVLQEEQAGVEVRAPHIDADQSGKFIITNPNA
ncbi:MAG: NAD(P)-dependent oxidoreductase [Chloroflexota bacterium]|nr:NAD(P)-dependent oxidoreductase [Chloroflexota bacterium]